MSGRPIAKLKATVVGTGFTGVVHVEGLRRLGVDVVGVVGCSPEIRGGGGRHAGVLYLERRARVEARR